jgi:uncharacterized protein (TIGR00297 family)
MGLFAFALRFLSWDLAALFALAALLFNLFVLPRVGRTLYRDPHRRRDPGIVAYPAMVLVLILLFRHHREIAAAVWGMMAFGDPAASLAGVSLGGPTLPWNRKKRWSGLAAYLVVGGLAAWILFWWTLPTMLPLTGTLFLWPLGPAILLAGFLESSDTGLDDNWVPPLPASLLLFACSYSLWPDLWPAPHGLLMAAAINAAIALVTGRLGIVGRSGAVAGGIAGTLILTFGGWPSYAVLWTFFLAGTLATRLGYAEKLRRGTAQKRGGRRGAEHVLANCGLGVILCLLGFISLPLGKSLLALGFTASFAAALADTFGTEFGSLFAPAAFSLTRLRAVPTGTKGAVSLPGTAAGLLGGFLVGFVAAAAGLLRADRIWIAAAAGLAGSLVESLLADGAARRGLSLHHDFANALNTLAGSLAAMEIFLSLEWGRLLLPMPGVAR